VRPLVVPYGQRSARRTIDVATVLDAPGRPSRFARPLSAAGAEVRRCRRCHRRVPTGKLVDGKGRSCARRDRARQPTVRRPKAVEHQGPDLMDLLAAGCGA
jgi:hypothetical protein